MKLVLSLVLAMAAILSACSAKPVEVVIEGVEIVSVHEGVPAGPVNVLLRDGVISAISSDLVVANGSAERIDGSGRFLAPGLMDSHHHVAFIPGLGAIGVSPASDNEALVAAYMAQQPRSLLYHGVTQILDPGPLLAWQDFEAQDLRPDFFRCGEIPNEPAGYPINQRDDPAMTGLYPYRLDGADTVEIVVDRIAEEGAICVKLYLEDGFGAASEWPILGHDILVRIRDAARARDMPVIAHANAIDMYQLALDAELDILGHGMWNWQWPEGDPPVAETLQRLHAQGAGYMSTHQVMSGLSGQLRARTLDDPMLADVVPASLMDWYRAGGADWFADELASDFPPDMAREEVADIFGFGVVRAQRATAYLYELGHPLLLASDCPGSPTSANQPGLCTLREIESLAEAGVAPEAILAAGTINPARQFGLDAHYGTVEVGKIANLLLLTEDPRVDAAAWNSIETVILHGEPIVRESLSAQ